jgi:protein-S-isoprenylcysteine O-methyltransferase Ste14
VTAFTLFWIAIGIGVLPVTLYLTAPFGRHANQRYGPVMSNRLGWMIMESPAIWCFSAVFFLGAQPDGTAAWLLWMFWMIHYLNRGLVFPLRIRTKGKQIPILIVVCAFVFQIINGVLNGAGLHAAKYTADWLAQPSFVIGCLAYFVGWGINLWSDQILLSLRQPNETGYRIPVGGMFRWVSCPNFAGEMIQWIGWAVMCWNLAGLSFAIWTIANLVPRGLAHHRWYAKNFADYPTERTALVPKLL